MSTRPWKVVKSNVVRLWEGFPVLVANAAETYQFEPGLVAQWLNTEVQRTLFRRLMLFSGALFSLYHLSFAWWNKFRKGFSNREKALVKAWKTDLSRNHVVEWNGAAPDSERVKGLFRLYFEERADKERRRKEKLEEYSLEYALSQVFSPKQKELFKKKLEGLPRAKSENEYYSKTVKKKLMALANTELHSLSKKLLGL
jgi:hypothetical protein